jgi:F-type H+-transporting ATPase subunit b
MPSVALAAAAGGGGGITDVNLVLTAATIVLFLIFAFVLSKFAWGPLLHAIEEREQYVRGAVEGAQKANADAAALLAQHQEMVREAGQKREEIIKQSLADAEKLRQELSEKARAESEEIVQKARAQIEREKRLAVQELRAQVADLAVEAAAKIVTSSLTPEAQKKLVHEFIDGLPRAKG